MNSISQENILDKENPIVILELYKEDDIDNSKLYAIELYQKYTPLTVSNFLSLVKSDFYINKKFNDNSAGILKCDKSCEIDSKEKGPLLEISPRLSHKKSGTLGMMRDIKKDYSSKTKFYITSGESNKNYLDGTYVVFGGIVSGNFDVSEIDELYNWKIIDYN